MKISIIVPMFNIEAYIGQCIESIINQDYTDLEIFLIDDGSTDKTGEICKEYAKKDERICYLYKENGGSGSARNVGIKKASGDYILCFDGDDFFIENSAISKMVAKINIYNPDIFVYNMSTFFQKYNKIVADKNITNEDKFFDNKIKFLKETISNGKLSISPWDKMVRTRIIKEYSIFFSNDVNLEDLTWSLKLYEKIQTVYVYNEPLYVYRKQRENSNTYTISESKINCMLNTIKSWLDYSYEDKEIQDLYYNYLAYQYTILMALANSKNTTRETRIQIKELQSLLNYDLNIKVKKALAVYKIAGYNGLRQVLKIYLFLKNRSVIRM